MKDLFNEFCQESHNELFNSEQEAIDKISKKVDMGTLVVFWQLILKVINELSIVSSPILSLEMLVVRLVHLKEMPSYEQILEMQQANDTNQTETNNTTIDLNINKKKIINEENEITKTS